MSQSSNVISARSLTKRYGSRRGVDALDLDVERGTLFGFLGPNGAGKSTTIRMLTGFLPPTSGSASVFGLDCWTESARIKTDVGYLPGDVRLYSWMTAESALRIVGRIRKRDLRKPGADLCERFRLDPLVKVSQMSRGTRQKLGLVIALAHDPALLVLDEPTSGLDPLIQEELANVLRDRAARGDTVFFSSHTLSEVESLCDQIAIVRDGRIVVDEPLSTMRARARRAVVLRCERAEDAAEVRVPTALRVLDRAGKRLRCEMEGDDVRAIAAWVAQQPVEDFSISPPDLEGMFRGYYVAAEPAAAGGNSAPESGS